MLIIDPRAGSKGLVRLFPKDMVVETMIPACDVLLTSQDGDQFWSGVEFKRINDLLACIITGRFAGTQLPAMSELVDDYWLLIEGPIMEGRSGELMIQAHGKWFHARVGGRYFEWSDLQTWMITMQTLTPLKIKVVQNRTETRDWIMTLHAWWERGKEKHRSHMVVDMSRDHTELVKASLLRRWAGELPGIGHDKAIRVEQHFRYDEWPLFEMVVADPGRWAKIEGIGVKMGERIVKAIRGEE